MQIDREAAEAKFDDFLMLMDDQLDWLSNEAKKQGFRLDNRLDDLKKLENLFDLMSYGKDKDHISKLVVTFSRYLGELVRVNYGGKWTLPLDDEKNVNFNTPVIIEHTSINGLEFAPISVMRSYALRRKPGTLQRAVNAQVNPKPIDLSGSAEDE
jgi:hypothetical protein